MKMKLLTAAALSLMLAGSALAQSGSGGNNSGGGNSGAGDSSGTNGGGSGTGGGGASGSNGGEGGSTSGAMYLGNPTFMSQFYTDSSMKTMRSKEERAAMMGKMSASDREAFSKECKAGDNSTRYADLCEGM